MEYLTFLATPDGKLVFPDSDEFLASLGDDDPDYDAVAFAVKNLGFIKLQTQFRSPIMEIKFHPRNTELRAVQAAEKLLLASQTKQFVIKYLDQEWQSEISPSVEHAIARINELCEPHLTPAARNRRQPLSEPSCE